MKVIIAQIENKFKLTSPNVSKSDYCRYYYSIVTVNHFYFGANLISEISVHAVFT